MADDENAKKQHDAEKEKKRLKALKRMSKMVMKAWEIEGSDPFQTAPKSSTERILCLTSLGQKVDQKMYGGGRHGWEDFARDMGGIYNRHIQRKTKKEDLAREQLEEVCEILASKDESLAKAAREAPPPAGSDRRDSQSSSKKRKSLTGDDGDKSNGRKKQRSTSLTQSHFNDGSMSEKEVEQMEKLEDFVEEKGADRSLVSTFRCRVFNKMVNGSERYDANYYNEQGKRFRSMLEVGRFLGIVTDNKNARSAAGAKSRAKIQKRRPTTASGRSKEVAAERKKLRRELERLRKQYSRATKSLDDFVNAEDKESTEAPVDDSTLLEKDPSVQPSNCSATLVPDIQQFRGIPDHCMADTLQAWDFLSTFSRVLHLQTISLESFVSCLTYQSPIGPADSDALKEPPVFLGEAHLSLLRLILDDTSSDEWWWSILETEQTENAVVADAAEAAAKEDENELPLIKVDFAALLADPEDPLMTTSWLKVLRPICNGTDKDKTAMRKTLKSAMALVSNKWVLAYMRKAIQLGKSSGSAFFRRAIVWLVENVTKSKPELSSNAPSKSEALKIRAKIVEDISQQMTQLSSANLKVEVEDLVSDAEDDESDDESDDEGDDKTESKDIDGDTVMESEEDRPASYIPEKPTPSLVDFLLPPGKPASGYCPELFNPACWPYMVGAASSRIVHRYKRLRNEVDDGLRKKHDLERLTVKERKEREAMSTGRVLTEFASQESVNSRPAEEAIGHLCEGGHYLNLSPLQRLAILRVLIDAAYDTKTLCNIIDSNHKQRTTAAKALDNEKRKAKKEAKEKVNLDEIAARESLALELKNNFIEEKREDIRKLNETSAALSSEEIEELTEQDILDFDEEYAAEFEALPTPESFKKAEVLTRVKHLQELAAFETESLTIVTLEELLEREQKDIERMHQEVSDLGGYDILEDEELDRRTARRIEKLRRDIKKAKEALEDYPEVRAAAVTALKEAISDGTAKSLRSALRLAKNAKLYGPDEETNGVYAVDVVRDAHLEVEKAKNMKRVADAQKELVSKLNKCFIRTVPLGSDRFRNHFWRFDNGDQSLVWTEVNTVLSNAKNLHLKNEPGHVAIVRDDPSSISIGPQDFEIDFPSTDSEAKDRFQAFSRREYHGSGAIAALPKRLWGCHVKESSIRALMKGLDSRGIRENDMKKILKETLDEKSVAAAPSGSSPRASEDDSKKEKGSFDDSKPMIKSSEADEVDSGISSVKTSGDEAALESVKKAVSGVELVLSHALEQMKTAIGQNLRVRTLLDSTRDGEIAKYECAIVTGWKVRKDEVPMDTGEAEFEPKLKEVDTPLWQAWTEQCEEVWLEGPDLLESIQRYSKWQQKDKDYFESDADFLSYRNPLGKFCGKAAEATLAMSPFKFGQYMVMCEAELYQGLKVLAVENNWGGKSAMRNNWITSMKDFSFDFSTVKDGLLTLENAIFDLAGGFKDGKSDDDDGGPSGKDLLDDETKREDIELESITETVTGLWSSRESRKVFMEIMHRCNTVGVLFLCLELVCRNARAYIVKNGVTSKAGGRRASSNVGGEPPAGGYDQYAPLSQRTTRRMNAWQQEQSAHDASFWAAEPSTQGGGRRGRRAPVSYAEPDMSFLDDLE